MLPDTPRGQKSVVIIYDVCHLHSLCTCVPSITETDTSAFSSNKQKLDQGCFPTCVHLPFFYFYKWHVCVHAIITWIQKHRKLNTSADENMYDVLDKVKLNALKSSMHTVLTVGSGWSTVSDLVDPIIPGKNSAMLQLLRKDYSFTFCCSSVLHTCTHRPTFNLRALQNKTHWIHTAIIWLIKPS